MNEFLQVLFLECVVGVTEQVTMYTKLINCIIFLFTKGKCTLCVGTESVFVGL